MSSKVALVTGAGMGIGAAIAARLARDGCAVVIADLNTQAAQDTAQKLQGEGREALALTMNVGDAGSIAAGFEAVAQRYGRCDILVNNAGIAKTFEFVDYPLDHWHQVMAVNVTGSMLCGQHAARMMLPHGWGRIINLSSVAGLRASAGRTAYGTSKAAVVGLTRQMAIELAPHGITVNGIAPGPIDTPLTRELHSDVSRQNYLRATPAGRYGVPEEIAGAISFLASDDASYVTGHILPVDGGFMAAGILEI
ncbi:3-oxoacyl-(acyl-carrier-protein) reductase [Pandoraea thiooxydans]|uniref:Oxidoreductase n=1 Tax=Pandoraea thiooxydans TaxID=445709 RepID=A0A0G3EP22_9BURK|nr:3-oxoacyl-ACP reductase family protein [Pandoraea thiooxydans]AKJ67057.1 oxidoreductase [Pandoraea thiooxydans]APR93990.1 3-oxoacyl-(acyl-carrier-protein) reductase [Pandoraea thiooxydans]